MTDPAVEAAEHALNQRPWFGYGNKEQLALIAAREALKPIRELHKSREGIFGGLICNGCNQSWPCNTAKLIYTTEELES